MEDSEYMSPSNGGWNWEMKEILTKSLFHVIFSSSSLENPINMTHGQLHMTELSEHFVQLDK